jgi:hypothetical protein
MPHDYMDAMDAALDYWEDALEFGGEMPEWLEYFEGDMTLDELMDMLELEIEETGMDEDNDKGWW